MPIEGPLRELHIHDVFQLLDLARKTGVLRIRSAARQDAGRVVFSDGAVVAADRLSEPDPLGPALVRAGRITEAQLQRARTMQREGDARRLGDILVGTGAISRRELDRQARILIEDVLFELLGWSEGYFTFEEVPVERAGTEAIVRIPTEAILMEAARRIDEWSQIEGVVPHLGVVPRLAPEADTLLDLTPVEWETLASVDGERTVRDIAQACGRSEFDTAKTILGLVTTGIVELADPARARAAELAPIGLAELRTRAEEYLAIGDAASAEAVAREALAHHPAQAGAHLLAGQALLALRRFDEAAAALEAALAREPALAPARRLLGFAEFGRGRHDAARAAWRAWREGPRGDAELALEQKVTAAEAAATLAAEALRGAHV